MEVQDDLDGRDLADALAMLEAAYPRINAEMWQWQYANHYLGRPLVAVARVGGRVVGVQPSIRHDAWWKGSPARSFQLAHVVTHPKFRRRGIFTALVGAFAAHADREGVSHVYTFPNRLSYPGFQRIPTWEHPFSMPLMARTRIGSGRPRRGRLEGRPIDTFDDAVDELGSTIGRRGLTGRVRDHRYLNWRYVQHPERAYLCLGLRDGPRWRAFAVGRTVIWAGVPMGVIIELLGDPDAIDHVLAGLEEALVRRGALALGCLMLPGREESELLRRRGYRIVPSWAVRKEFYFVVRAPGGLENELRAPRAWWLTWGDNDIV